MAGSDRDAALKDLVCLDPMLLRDPSDRNAGPQRLLYNQPPLRRNAAAEPDRDKQPSPDAHSRLVIAELPSDGVTPHMGNRRRIMKLPVDKFLRRFLSLDKTDVSIPQGVYRDFAPAVAGELVRRISAKATTQHLLRW